MKLFHSARCWVVFLGITFVAFAVDEPHYHKKVHQLGEVKGYCWESNQSLTEKARRIASGSQFTIGCTDWKDQLEEFGYPECQYKKVVSSRDCTVNPF